MNQKVFISYSSADEELAKKLAKILKETGIDHSLGRRDTSEGSYNAEEDRKALSECPAVVVVVSPASLKSAWVPFEVGNAMGAGKKILLLLTQPYLNVPAYLQGIHCEANLDSAKEYLKHMFDAPPDKTKPAENKPALNGSKLEILNYKDEKGIPAKATPSKKSTGIKSLDTLLEGGITCGSVVTIAADPRATAEVWLYQIAQIDRTFYFTTEKSPRDIQENIHLPNFNLGDVYFIDIYSHYINGISNDYILNMTENYLEKISSDSAQERPTIIFDNFSFYLNLDIDPKSFKVFINRINKKIKKMEAVLYLYIFKQNNNQLEHLIYSLSDTIFEIGFKKHSERITNYLSVLKNKKGYLPKEAIRLKFEDGMIQIDTTKDVA